MYLLDITSDNLFELKKAIESTYPDVKATVVVADAADEKAISKLCQLALKEEGRLDVFFANVSVEPELSRL